MSSNKSSLARRTSKPGRCDGPLKPCHLHLSGSVFSRDTADGLGAASADGSHHMRIENIRGILESHDSAHIAAALDPGTQTVPCIHLTIRDQRLCRPSGNSPGKDLLSASRIDSHMVGNTVFHHRVFQDIRNNSTGCTGSPQCAVYCHVPDH